jgi:hypothetical protein
MSQEFNFNEAREQIKAGVSIDGKDGVLAPLMKQLTKVVEEKLFNTLSNKVHYSLFYLLISDDTRELW